MAGIGVLSAILAAYAFYYQSFSERHNFRAVVERAVVTPAFMFANKNLKVSATLKNDGNRNETLKGSAFVFGTKRCRTGVDEAYGAKPAIVKPGDATTYEMAVVEPACPSLAVSQNVPFGVLFATADSHPRPNACPYFAHLIWIGQYDGSAVHVDAAGLRPEDLYQNNVHFGNCPKQ